MNRNLGKQLKKCFAGRIQQRLPYFREVATKAPGLGGWLYEWRIGPDLSCFLFLWPSPKDDRFTVEGAWSRTGGFPNSALPSDPNQEPVEQQLRFRLSSLWTKKDVWWWLGREPTLQDLIDAKEEPLDDKMRHVEPQVEAAIQKVMEYALPFFKRIAGKCGYSV